MASSANNKEKWIEDSYLLSQKKQQSRFKAYYSFFEPSVTDFPSLAELYSLLLRYNVRVSV